ncbi:MAG: hypothetical protein RQ982_03605 [Gammaproteobacteria bacterium]|nr:hypothetical protein [Gammaproteobacteria bacterium]
MLVHAFRHAFQIASKPNGIPAMGIVPDMLDWMRWPSIDPSTSSCR